MAHSRSPLAASQADKEIGTAAAGQRDRLWCSGSKGRRAGKGAGDIAVAALIDRDPSTTIRCAATGLVDPKQLSIGVKAGDNEIAVAVTVQRCGRWCADRKGGRAGKAAGHIAAAVGRNGNGRQCTDAPARLLDPKKVARCVQLTRSPLPLLVKVLASGPSPKVATPTKCPTT